MCQRPRGTLETLLLTWVLIVASPFVGSFLGVAIERIPTRRQLLWGRSCCDLCGHMLRAIDLVPLASWMFLRGHCRYCGAKLAYFYPLIELAALAVALLSAAFATGPTLVASCIFGWLFLVLAGIAWRSRQ